MEIISGQSQIVVGTWHQLEWLVSSVIKDWTRPVPAIQLAPKRTFSVQATGGAKVASKEGRWLLRP